jgi:hypothetical protein
MNRLTCLIVTGLVSTSASRAEAQQPYWNVRIEHGNVRPVMSAAQQMAASARVGGRTGLNSVTIAGRATRASGGVPNSVMRLRDARFGRIIDQQLTDRTGAFTFRNVGAGNYVVELLGRNQITIAATQLINVNGGEIVTAIVRLPSQPSLFAGILGQQGPPGAALSPAGLTDAVPTLLEQLPQVAVQTLPAVVPVGSPTSAGPQ